MHQIALSHKCFVIKSLIAIDITAQQVALLHIRQCLYFCQCLFGITIQQSFVHARVWYKYVYRRPAIHTLSSFCLRIILVESLVVLLLELHDSLHSVCTGLSAPIAFRALMLLKLFQVLFQPLQGFLDIVVKLYMCHRQIQKTQSLGLVSRTFYKCNGILQFTHSSRNVSARVVYVSKHFRGQILFILSFPLSAHQVILHRVGYVVSIMDIHSVQIIHHSTCPRLVVCFIVFILNSMALICPTGSIHHLWVFLRTCRPHCFMKFMVLYCIFAMLCLRLYLG